MVEAAEQRKAAERRRLAQIVAVAFNEPAKLDEVAPKPAAPERPGSQGVSRQDFSQEQWW